MGNYDNGVYDGFGVRLTGGPDPVHIQASGLALRVASTGQSWATPYRESELVVMSKRHLHRGTITGYLVRRNADGTPGTAVGAREWAQRLFHLLYAQRDYTIALKSDMFCADKVRFPDEYSIEAAMVPASGQALYSVTLPFVEVE